MHPMLLVSWYGAVGYANWRSAQHGRTPCYDLSTWECDFDANGYRLPTEAEWEYAARGGNHNPYRRYPWGDAIDGSMANYLGSGDPYEPAPHHPDTTPVGYYDGNQVPAGVDMVNGYGLYDVAGNVWEWCNDWYNSTYYSSSPYDNPTGPGSGMYCVTRGDGWYYDPRGCAYRGNRSPTYLGDGDGFQLALDAG
jgi:formylglycine-generating enzyme required for sulfatase activity